MDKNMTNNNLNRDSLLMLITEYEFAALDIQLYLNTHPCDKEAIAKYNQLNTQSKMLRTEYEERFGPLFSYISLSDENYFSWIDEPWPWDTNYLTPSKTTTR